MVSRGVLLEQSVGYLWQYRQKRWLECDAGRGGGLLPPELLLAVNTAGDGGLGSFGF